MQAFSRNKHLCIVMLSSRAPHMTPAVQESRQEHHKDKCQNQCFEEDCTRPQIQGIDVNDNSPHCQSFFCTGMSLTCMFVCAWQNIYTSKQHHFINSDVRLWPSITARLALRIPSCLNYQQFLVKQKTLQRPIQHTIMNRRTWLCYFWRERWQRPFLLSRRNPVKCTGHLYRRTVNCLHWLSPPLAPPPPPSSPHSPPPPPPPCWSPYNASSPCPRPVLVHVVVWSSSFRTDVPGWLDAWSRDELADPWGEGSEQADPW